MPKRNSNEHATGSDLANCEDSVPILCHTRLQQLSLGGDTYRDGTERRPDPVVKTL
jgi:hypothetical protein